MATRSLRFDFQCGRNPQQLIVHHNIPAILIRDDEQGMFTNDAQFAQLLTSTLLPIVRSYNEILLEKSNQQCAVCSEPSISIIHMPMPWVHVTDDPSINIMVIDYCRKRNACETVIRQRAQTKLQAMDDNPRVREWSAPRPGTAQKASMTATRRICDKAEGSKFCQKCELVAYCGKAHKKICASLANGDRAL